MSVDLSLKTISDLTFKQIKKLSVDNKGGDTSHKEKEDFFDLWDKYEIKEESQC